MRIPIIFLWVFCGRFATYSSFCRKLESFCPSPPMEVTNSRRCGASGFAKYLLCGGISRSESLSRFVPSPDCWEAKGYNNWQLGRHHIDVLSGNQLDWTASPSICLALQTWVFATISADLFGVPNNAIITTMTDFKAIYHRISNYLLTKSSRYIHVQQNLKKSSQVHSSCRLYQIYAKAQVYKVSLAAESSLLAYRWRSSLCGKPLA